MGEVESWPGQCKLRGSWCAEAVGPLGMRAVAWVLVDPSWVQQGLLKGLA